MLLLRLPEDGSPRLDCALLPEQPTRFVLLLIGGAEVGSRCAAGSGLPIREVVLRSEFLNSTPNISKC